MSIIRTLYSRKIDHYQLLESVIRDETSAFIISSILTTVINDVLTTRYEFLQSTALNMCTLTNKHVAENAQYNVRRVVTLDPWNSRRRSANGQETDYIFAKLSQLPAQLD